MRKQAFEYLIFYQNICKIRRLIHDISERFYKAQPRLAGQMRDAARSAKQNIREGYRKDTAREFAQGIRISRGSLFELEGDIDDCFEDKIISREEHSILKDLFGKTNYQIDRYLDSLYKMDKEGKWKRRFKSNR